MRRSILETVRFSDTDLQPLAALGAPASPPLAKLRPAKVPLPPLPSRSPGDTGGFGDTADNAAVCDDIRSRIAVPGIGAWRVNRYGHGGSGRWSPSDVGVHYVPLKRCFQSAGAQTSQVAMRASIEFRSSRRQFLMRTLRRSWRGDLKNFQMSAASGMFACLRPAGTRSGTGAIAIKPKGAPILWCSESRSLTLATKPGTVFRTSRSNETVRQRPWCGRYYRLLATPEPARHIRVWVTGGADASDHKPRTD